MFVGCSKKDETSKAVGCEGKGEESGHTQFERRGVSEACQSLKQQGQRGEKVLSSLP